VKLKELFLLLLEVGNIKASNIQYTWDGQKAALYFKVDDITFGIEVEVLRLNDFKHSPVLDDLGNPTIINIRFGDVKPGGRLNLKHVKRDNGYSFRAISIVRNMVIGLVKNFNTEFVVFSAKNNDEVYKSRSKLYHTFCDMTHKSLGYNYLNFVDENGTYYLLIRNDISLNTKQIIAIKREVVTNLSLKETIKGFLK
jgi:hypothetical protein